LCITASLATLFKKTRIVGLFGLLCLIYVLRSQVIYPQNHIRNLLQNQAIIRENITFKVHNILKKKDDFYRYDIELKSLESHSISGHVYLNEDQELIIGNTYSGLLEITQIEGVTNPNQFDYSMFSERKSIYGSSILHTAAKLEATTKWNLNRFIFNIRSYLLQRIEQRFYSYSDFVSAVLLAEREYESERVKRIQQSGLQHLLAVSGLHVGIITLILISIANALIPKRKISYVIVLLLLLFYGFLCNWQASVMRAVCMIFILFFGKIIERPISGLRILFLSFYILLFMNPNHLYGIGFQLSFLAVYILVSYLPYFQNLLKEKITFQVEAKWLEVKSKVFTRYLILFFITTTLLSFGLAPITIFYFQELNLNGLIANFVGIPLMGLLLPAMILILIVPELMAEFYFRSFHIMMSFFDSFLSWTSTLSFRFSFLTMNHLQFMLGILIVITFAFWFIKSVKKYRAISVFLSLFFILSFRFVEQNPNAKITFFDCGLGDLILIEADQQTMMIDCGPGIKEKKSFKNSALPYLKINGIHTIQKLIITHGHLDHFGGLPDLLASVKVDSILVTPNFFEQNIIQKYDDLIDLESVQKIVAPQNIIWNKARFEILHPDSLYFDEDKNNMSIVIRFLYDEFEVLLTGDLEEDGEDYLLEKYPDLLNCDVLKVGHHGSSSSTDVDFLDATTPEYAIISTSEKNRFRFPHAQTLKRLSAFRDNVLITGKEGAVQMETDGKSAIIKTMKTQRYFIDSSL
jgi:competence protein ComEC